MHLAEKGDVAVRPEQQLRVCGADLFAAVVGHQEFSSLGKQQVLSEEMPSRQTCSSMTHSIHTFSVKAAAVAFKSFSTAGTVSAPVAQPHMPCLP